MDQGEVGAIGLGLLGSALVERLLAAGHRVQVYNRTRAKADPLLALGARWCDNPLAECSVVVVCLYTTEIVQQTLLQLGDPRPGTLVIDTTTGDPQQTRALGELLAARGVRYLEAPIMASSDQTRRGEALTSVAGRHADYLQALPWLQVLAPRSVYVGEWGNGAKMKLVNNLILGLNRAALAEGLAFASALGLAPTAALEFLQQGNARSVAMELKGQKMVERDFVPQAKLSQHLKDVRLILAEAAAAHRSLPLTALHQQLLERVEAAGGGELDNSAILQVYDLL